VVYTFAHSTGFRASKVIGFLQNSVVPDKSSS
jgi:hypothetical protein